MPIARILVVYGESRLMLIENLSDNKAFMRTLIITTLLVLALGITADVHGEDTVQDGRQLVLQNVYSRDITSLNGTWQTIVDPFDAGFYDYRLAESPTGFFKNQKAKDPSDMVEYDFSPAE